MRLFVKIPKLLIDNQETTIPTNSKVSFIVSKLDNTLIDKSDITITNSIDLNKYIKIPPLTILTTDSVKLKSEILLPDQTMVTSDEIILATYTDNNLPPATLT